LYKNTKYLKLLLEGIDSIRLIFYDKSRIKYISSNMRDGNA